MAVVVEQDSLVEAYQSHSLKKVSTMSNAQAQQRYTAANIPFYDSLLEH